MSAPVPPPGARRGWICLHRGWRDCEAFEEPCDPMSDADAWAWLIEHAAWRAIRRTGGQGAPIRLERGQIHVSDRALATAFRWDRKRVRRYLDRLAAHGMVAAERGPSGTVLTLCNYDRYQHPPEAKGPARGQAGAAQEQGKHDSGSDEPAVPPAGTLKRIFDMGATLLAASGHEARAARSILGRWRKQHGDAAVLAALIDAEARAISNPVEWIARRLNAAASASAAARPDDRDPGARGIRQAGAQHPAAATLDALLRQAARYRDRENTSGAA